MAKVVPQMTRMDAICAEIGWQLDLLGPYWLYEEMHDTLKSLKSNFTIAHFGMWRGQSGADSPGFKRFLDLLSEGERKCWVKLTAPYRLGSPPLYGDAVPIARALIEAAPDRVIWGSDYPFLSHADRVNAVSLFNLIPTWVPDAATRKQSSSTTRKSSSGSDGRVCCGNPGIKQRKMCLRCDAIGMNQLEQTSAAACPAGVRHTGRSWNCGAKSNTRHL